MRAGIWIYQKLIGPVLHAAAGPGAGCRFTPSCSNYFLQAVEIHGPWRGSWLGICRIFRCHPWGGSGYDPVPPPRGSGGRPAEPPPKCGSHHH
ncbi:MAG: membrane protein insertion efficiency factor YidD [Verrucomicrobiae bacterium]|nr:membrane protein insertion efficiency factor YidD [Verrucomicrobiae bacterium]